MSASKELSKDLNNNRIGSHGGTSSRDICNKDTNIRKGAGGTGVSQELSKDSAKLTNKGKPDKGLFESSK